MQEFSIIVTKPFYFIWNLISGSGMLRVPNPKMRNKLNSVRDPRVKRTLLSQGDGSKKKKKS